jgi:hypothetical protein
MAFKSAQIALNSSTATALNPQGTGVGQFPNVIGTDGDEIPFLFKNADGSATIYVGGPGVTTANGYPIAAGASVPAGIVGDNETLYGIALTGTPVVAVLAGRQ